MRLDRIREWNFSELMHLIPEVEGILGARPTPSSERTARLRRSRCRGPLPALPRRPPARRRRPARHPTPPLSSGARKVGYGTPKRILPNVPCRDRVDWGFRTGLMHTKMNPISRLLVIPAKARIESPSAQAVSPCSSQGQALDPAF